MRPRIFVTQPVSRSAIERLLRVASVKVNPDSSRIPDGSQVAVDGVAGIVRWIT